MSYEVYIDIEHHPRHNDDDAQHERAAFKLGDDDYEMTRAFGTDKDAPIKAALADCLRMFADDLDPQPTISAEQLLEDDDAIMRGVRAVQRMGMLRVGDKHDHAEAFRKALASATDADASPQKPFSPSPGAYEDEQKKETE